MLDKFVSIIWAIIKNPYEYFSSEMPKDNSVKEPIIFAIIVSCVSLLPYLLMSSFYSQITAAITLFVLMPVFITAGLYINAFLVHSLVFLFCPQRSNFKQTFKVLAYSNAPAVFIVMPVIGVLAAAIFQIRSVIFGLSAVHKVSALKMFMLFVIIPIILVAAFAVLLIAVFGAALMPFYRNLLSSF